MTMEMLRTNVRVFRAANADYLSVPIIYIFAMYLSQSHVCVFCSEFGYCCVNAAAGFIVAAAVIELNC